MIRVIRVIRVLIILLVFVCSSVYLPVAAVYANEDSGEDSTPSGIPFSEMENSIDSYVSRYLHQTTPGAAIVVIKDGEIVFSKGYGYADIQNQTTVDPAATIFEYASISKLFVWISVMQLAEQGKLDLDADIKIYLPDDFSSRLKLKKPITMRDLMNHSAGFSDWIFDLGYDARKIERTDTLYSAPLHDALLASQPEQTFEPGAISVYSNFGSALAGYIVQCVSGQDYARYEMDNILTPAGMTGALNQPYWFHNDAFLESKAEGYAPDGKGGFSKKMWEYTPIYPCGAINGTAEDLARFGIALTPQEGAASPLFEGVNSLPEVFAPSYPDASQMVGTRHGFEKFGSSPLAAYGHGGNTAGFSSIIMVVPEDRFGVVVLVNSLGEMDIVYGVADLLIGGNMDTVKPGAGALPDTKSVEGTYVTARRYEKTMALVANYMQLAKVTAIDESSILFSMGPFEAAFLQTEPYVFQIISSENPMLRMGVDTLRFKMEGEKPIQIIIGNGADFTSLPPGREMPFLIASLAITAAGILFFLIMLIIRLIEFIRKRSAPFTRFKYLNTGLYLCGTLFSLNNILGFMRMGVIDNYRSASEMMPHIWINWALLILTAALLAMSMLTARRETITKKPKTLYTITVTIMVLFIIVMFYWNFFTFL